MTPTQLRAFAAVARHGSVRAAAEELGVSESAVSLHMGHLRAELDDVLFTRTSSGLAFTPGGLRLASRAVEILGLQDQTVREVSRAGAGRRLLRIGATSLFAEHSAPGMIELFLQRAEDLEVELSVRTPTELASLLAARAVDVAIGPTAAVPDAGLVANSFLKYELVAVVSPDHRLATGPVAARALREQVWLLPPAASNPDDVYGRLLRQLGVPEQAQRIFQSHAAAVDEAKRGNGVALALNYPISADLAGGRLVAVRMPGLSGAGTWSTYTLAEPAVAPVVAELTRFMTSPRAIQAMLRGSGVNVGHFRPSIHVTLWG